MLRDLFTCTTFPKLFYAHHPRLINMRREARSVFAQVKHSHHILQERIAQDDGPFACVQTKRAIIRQPIRCKVARRVAFRKDEIGRVDVEGCAGNRDSELGCLRAARDIVRSFAKNVRRGECGEVAVQYICW